MAKLISQERVGNRIERYWLHSGDDGKDRITIETVEDVEPVLEANKKLYNEKPVDDPVLGRKVASIPGTVLEELCRIHKIKFRDLMNSKNPRGQKILNEFLNDPAMRFFRTAPGRVDMRRMT